MSMQQTKALVGLGTEMVMLSKALVVSVMVMCVLMGLAIMKK